jgi:hypothetical protein
MKRFFIISFFIVYSIVPIIAQTDIDALRYATPSLQGTARNIALGNTMDAVGADISNTHSNPAGLAKFSSTEITFSPGISFYKTNSNFLSTQKADSKIKFQVSNFGVVIAKRYKKQADIDVTKKWNGIKIGLSFARLANYNEKYFFSGNNDKNSLLNNYWEKLSDRNIIKTIDDARNVYPFDASIAYQLGLLSIDDSTGNTFIETDGGTKFQEIKIEKTGGMDEFAIGIASEYQSKLLVGASIGIPTINYTERIFIKETYSNDSIDLNWFSNETYLKSKGVGFNIKVGVIYTPIKNLKLSVALQTPGIIFMRDNYKTTMEADFKKQSDILVGESPDGSSSYKYIQPLRLNAGISYVHKYGLVAFGYELSDVQMSKFKLNQPEAIDYENFLNNQIKNKYGIFHTIKFGAEFKVQKFRLRGGVQYRTSPFDKNAAPTGIKTDVLTFSGGFGYRAEHFFVDLVYVQTNTKEMFLPYSIDQDLWKSTVPAATLSIKKPSIFFTVGYKL